MSAPKENSPLVKELLEALAAQRSLKKNGESLPEWLLKVITPGRIMWFLLAVSQLVQLTWIAGGKFRDVQVRLEASDQTASIVKGLEENTKKQDVITTELAGTVEELMAQNAALAATARGLNDRVSLTITRAEFNRAMQLQIIPRLEKIEKAQTTAAQFSGEK
jgi:hypothetical protein